MKLAKMKIWAFALCVACAMQIAVVSCSDDPGVQNYYTQTKEYAASYLQNREQYSEYLKILERARGEYNLRLVDMLGTYGSYTVFGETIEGLDVIDKIAAVETDRRDRPVAQVKIIKVTAE